MFKRYARSHTFTHCRTLSVFFLFIVITGPYTETTITGPTKIKGNEIVIAGGFQE